MKTQLCLQICEAPLQNWTTKTVLSSVCGVSSCICGDCVSEHHGEGPKRTPVISVFRQQSEGELRLRGRAAQKRLSPVWD